MVSLDDEDTVSLGPTNGYRKVEYKGDWVGIREIHLNSAGSTCYGYVPFDTPEAKEVSTEQAPKWQVESWEPLTLSPSLLCTICGSHGFIKQGKWVAA